MYKKEIADAVLSLSRRLVEEKCFILKSIIEKIENRESSDEDWGHMVLVQHQTLDVLIVSKEEVYYKKIHIGTISIRLENGTYILDFTPAHNPA
jgi:hypothetical protein